MCLGGGPRMPAPTYQPIQSRVVEPGPESPNDSLNNVDVENVNERSQQDTKRKANKGPTATAQSSKTDKAY